MWVWAAFVAFIVAMLLVFPVSFALYRTRWGLRLRSCGENPEAARSLGVRVAPLRYEGVLLSGALAGLAGAYLAVEVAYSWGEGQTQGLGFIALAALILSNWNPVRLMVASFVCVVAAPEGVKRLAADHPEVPVFTAALDRQLNDQGFILPGLGDFGDRLHGTV